MSMSCRTFGLRSTSAFYCYFDKNLQGFESVFLLLGLRLVATLRFWISIWAVVLIFTPRVAAQNFEPEQCHLDDIPPGAVVIEGDILIPQELAGLLGDPLKSAAYHTKLWPDGIVPYTYTACN